MEAVECGAACLAMILGFYQRYVTLESLRYACGVSRDGTSAANVVKAARAFGLEAKGFTAEPGALGDFNLPFVVFWEMNHFVVVEGFDSDHVFLNDPASGPRTVSTQEFDRGFTGIVLTFQPGPDFVKGGTRRSVVDGLRRRLTGNGAAFAFVVLASFGLLVPGLLVPAFVRVFVDYYLVQGLTDWLQPLLLGMLVAALLRGVLQWLRQHYLLRLQTKLALRGACLFLWHLLRLPTRFFTQRYAGEIASRVTLNDRIAELIGGDLAVAVVSLGTMLVYALVMAGHDLLLAGLAVLFASLNLIAFVLVARHLSDGSQRLLQDESRLIGVATQGLQMMDAIKAGGTEDLFFSRWAGFLTKAINSEQTLSRVRVFLDGTPTLLSMLGAASILILGGFRVMEGRITIGTLVAFQALLTSFSAPLIDLVRLGSQLPEASADITRLDDILTHEIDADFSATAPTALPLPPVVEPPVPPPPRSSATAVAAAAPAFHQIVGTNQIKLTGRVQIRDLTYGYVPTAAPLIRGFSLDIEPGQRIALVGASGSGKSTVGKLIAGLYRPWSGDILFDGVSMQAIPRQVLRGSVALVDQDIVLFSGSISDNISLWDPTMPEDRIIRAAHDARIHDDIAARPENYAFHLAEGGRNFSGGQRQRIELARALASEPAVLILDEATSALDTTNEKQIIDNVRRRGCSCIIIAHRLSTIRDCDEILVLDQGVVVERGQHQALYDAKGRYRHLVES
jgi:NHLM bacteriocin system ABC transporter peptidase/ATP-binding protein